MVVSLTKDGLSLKRDDQGQEYHIEWASADVERQWRAVRTCFLENVRKCPESPRATQFAMLQMLLAVAELPSGSPGLDAQIQQYCYGTNAWMSFKDGCVSWRADKDSTKEASAPRRTLFERLGEDPAERRRWADEVNGDNETCTLDDDADLDDEDEDEDEHEESMSSTSMDSDHGADPVKTCEWAVTLDEEDQMSRTSEETPTTCIDSDEQLDEEMTSTDAALAPSIERANGPARRSRGTDRWADLADDDEDLGMIEWQGTW